MKNVVFLFATIAFLLMNFGRNAYAENSLLNFESEILNRVNNSLAADELIHYYYPEDELIKRNKNGIALEADAQHIECIRQIGTDTFYTVQKSKKCTLYLIFQRAIDGKLYSVQHWMVKDDATKKKFQNIKKGKSSYLDVKEIDPFAVYPMEFVGRTDLKTFESQHDTTDGYQIQISYTTVFKNLSLKKLLKEDGITLKSDFDRKVSVPVDYQVSNVKISKAEKNSFYRQLLKVDQ